MKGKKAQVQGKEKEAEAELRALELKIFKDFYKIMPETNKIAYISSQTCCSSENSGAYKRCSHGRA